MLVFLQTNQTKQQKLNKTKQKKNLEHEGKINPCVRVSCGVEVLEVRPGSNHITCAGHERGHVVYLLLFTDLFISFGVEVSGDGWRKQQLANEVARFQGEIVSDGDVCVCV